MLAVNYTCLRDNMKRYMDQVTDDYETLIVTRKNNKNVVMMSEWLMQSYQLLTAGNFSQHELAEVDVE
mgnify:CR=1 FL=1